MTMPTSRAAGIAPGFATDTLTHGAPNSRMTISPIAVANASTIWNCDVADELDEPFGELLVIERAVRWRRSQRRPVRPCRSRGRC